MKLVDDILMAGDAPIVRISYFKSLKVTDNILAYLIKRGK